MNRQQIIDWYKTIKEYQNAYSETLHEYGPDSNVTRKALASSEFMLFGFFIAQMIDCGILDEHGRLIDEELKVWRDTRA